MVLGIATPQGDVADDVKPNHGTTNGTDGQTVVTDQSSSGPWRSVASRPSTPKHKMANQRRSILKALTHFSSVGYGQDEIATFITRIVNGKPAYGSDNEEEVAAADDSTVHTNPGSVSPPYSPDRCPCSPAYPPSEAIVVRPLDNPEPQDP